MPVEMSWVWIAGFFEGEGNITWIEGKHGTKQGTGGRLTIGQKDIRPLVAIKEFLLAQGLKNPALYLRPKSTTQEMPRPAAIWVLAVCRRDDVLLFLENTREYFFQKQDKADFVIEKIRQMNGERQEILATALKLRLENKLTWRAIGQALGIHRTALKNYAQTQGINLEREPGFPDEMAWRDDRVARGLCEKCGNLRGEHATKRKCRVCADQYNVWRNKHRSIHGRTDHPQRQTVMPPDENWTQPPLFAEAL